MDAKGIEVSPGFVCLTDCNLWIPPSRPFAAIIADWFQLLSKHVCIKCLSTVMSVGQRSRLTQVMHKGTFSDILGSPRYTKRIISDLLQNKVDLSQLVITKALAKVGACLLRFSFYIFLFLDLLRPRLRWEAGTCRVGWEDETARRRYRAPIT
jgi:hypothetical protein